MSITSTRQAKEVVRTEVYDAMSPALEWPNQSYSGGKASFVERADIFISKDDQELLNPFMQRVCTWVRVHNGGYASSQAVFNEANRRVKGIIQHAAGKKGTVDGKRLSGDEVRGIRNPYVRVMVARATDVSLTPATDGLDDASSSSSSSSSSMPAYGAGSGGAGFGPGSYDDVPVDGPVTDGNSYWGPDGPNRGQDSGWGPDGPNRSGGSSWDGCGSGGSDYVGGYPLF